MAKGKAGCLPSLNINGEITRFDNVDDVKKYIRQQRGVVNAYARKMKDEGYPALFNRIAKVKEVAVQSKPVKLAALEGITPLVDGVIKIGNLAELSGVRNPTTLEGKNWDSMSLHDRIKTLLDNFVIRNNEDDMDILITHTGDRPTALLTSVKIDTLFNHDKIERTITPKKDVIGKAVKGIVGFNKRVYDMSKARVANAKKVSVRGGKLLYNGKEVAFDKINKSEEAKYIERMLLKNIDYTIENGYYVVGRAGTNRLFGVEAIKSAKGKYRFDKDEDYYTYLNDMLEVDKDLFYEMLDEVGYKIGYKSDLAKYNKGIKGSIKEKGTMSNRTNPMLEAYYLASFLVNESISNYMAFSNEYMSGDADFLSRVEGYTSPSNAIVGDPASETPNIGLYSNYVLAQDIPDGHGLFGGIKDALATDGVVYMLGFYKTALSNSAGGSMSYVGDGAIKTVNFSADANQGMVQYMKCSEMPIGASIWNRDIGKTIYQTLLDRVVTVEDNKGNRTNINPYDKFMENIKHDGYITQEEFNKANDDFLEYLWNTTAIDDNGNKVRLYDMVGHKMIFGSAMKVGQIGMVHWNKTADGSYQFPTGNDVPIMKMSNKNYGLQQNKIHTTQAENKSIMKQTIRIIGMFDKNVEVYDKIEQSLSNIINDEIKKINKLKLKNKHNVDEVVNYYVKKIKDKVFNDTDEKVRHFSLDNNTLEAVKPEIMNVIYSEISRAFNPDVDGGMVVQHPSDSYLRRGDNGEVVKMPLRPFGILDADGNEYTSKELLLEDIKNKDKKGGMKIRLQEVVMAFPYLNEYGLSKDDSLQDVFTVRNTEEGNIMDLFYTSEDYQYSEKEGRLTAKETLTELKERIALHNQQRFDKELNGAKSFVVEDNKKKDIRVKVGGMLKGYNKNVKKYIVDHFVKTTKHGGTISVDAVNYALASYYYYLNDACNLYSLRIPTNEMSAGFPSRIVEWDNTIGSTMLVSPKKSLLDGSDFDIDELNLYYLPTSPMGDLNANKQLRRLVVDSIMSYYANPDNAVSILNSITTDNIKKVTEDIDAIEGTYNTINHTYRQYEEAVKAEHLIGYFINMQTSVGNISALYNKVLADDKHTDHEAEMVNKLRLFNDDSLKQWFLDITLEFVNACTDNVKLNNAIGKLGVSTENFSLVAGIIMNIENEGYFKLLYESKRAVDNNYSEDEMMREYGLKKVTKDNNTYYTINDATEKNKPVEYAIEVIRHILSLPAVQEASRKVEANRNVPIGKGWGNRYSLAKEISRYKVDVNKRSTTTAMHRNVIKTKDFVDMLYERTFNSLPEAEKKGFNEKVMLESYGLKKQEKDNIVKYAVVDKKRYSNYMNDIAVMLREEPEVQAVIKDNLKPHEGVMGARRNIGMYLDILSGRYEPKEEITISKEEANVIKMAIDIGDAVSAYSKMKLEDFKHEPQQMYNVIFNIAKILGITETAKTVDGKKVIEYTVADNLKRTIDDINKGLEPKVDLSQAQQRYNIKTSEYNRLNNVFDYMMLLKYDKYLQSKIQMLLQMYSVKNNMFKTEQLIDAVVNRFTMENKMSYLERSDFVLLRKEVDKLYTGNMVNNVVTVGGITYDLTTEQRFDFLHNLKDIIADIRELFPDNYFLQSIRPISFKNNVIYGIPNLKYLANTEKKKLSASYYQIVNASNSNNTTTAENAETVLRVVESMTMLQQGYHGNSLDLSSVITPKYNTYDVHKAKNVDAMIDEIIDSVNHKEVKNTADDSHINEGFYRYLVMRGGAAKGIIDTKYNIVEGYTVEVVTDDKEAVYTMSVADGVTNATAFFDADRNSYINPWGYVFNMYGINGRATPILKEGNNTMAYISEAWLAKAMKKEDILLTEADQKVNYIQETQELSAAEKAFEEMNADEVKEAEKKAEESIAKFLKRKVGDKVLLGSTVYDITQPKTGGQVILQATKTTKDKKLEARIPAKNRISNRTSKRHLELFLDHLARVFPNVRIEYLNRGSFVSHVKNGVLYINMDRIGADVALHELGHIYTIILKATNIDAYNSLMREAQELVNNNAPVVQMIRQHYGEIDNESMLYEVIGNTLQIENADAMEALMLQLNASQEQKNIFRRFWEAVKAAFRNIGKSIQRIFGGKNLRVDGNMTIRDLGDVIMDAIATGKALSYMTSEDVADIYGTQLNSMFTSSINTIHDLYNCFSESTDKYQGKTDDEITDMIYDAVLKSKNSQIAYNNRIYDFKAMSQEDIKKTIKKNIVPFLSMNMHNAKQNIIKSIVEFNGRTSDETTLVGLLQNNLGKTEYDKPLYSIQSCVNLSKILQVDKTKRYYLLSDMIKNTNGIMDKNMTKFADAFASMKDFEGFDPIIAVEYVGEEMIISIYDFTAKGFSNVDPLVGRKNIAFRLGVLDREAAALGIELKNEEFDVRSLMLTVMTNILKDKGIKVRDVSVTKLNYGEDDRSTANKRVDMRRMNHNIVLLNQVEGFNSLIKNEDIKKVFEKPEEKLFINDINYWDLLGSLYTDYYAHPKKKYGEGVYDRVIYGAYDNLIDGTLTREQKLNLIRWRLKELSNISSESMTDYQISERRLLLDISKHFDETARFVSNYSTEDVLHAVNRYYNTFDIESEEVQFVRQHIINGQNKIVYRVREKKKEMKHIWEYFLEHKSDGRKRFTNSYYLFEDLFASHITKDGKRAFNGMILWTTDKDLDSVNYRQAQQMIAEGKLTQQDLDMAKEIAIEVENVYIKLLKHEQWKKTGSEDVVEYRTDALGREHKEVRKLTDDEWREKLYKRGFKRGMIPIMQKNYIDGMKSALKKWKIEQRLMGTQYAEATLNFYAADSERAVDSITNIFLDQIAASELNLEAQRDPDNISPAIDNYEMHVKRNFYLGLIRDDVTGEVVFREGDGESLNQNINKNLESVFDYFNLVMERKMTHEKETLPFINEFTRVIEFGKAYSADKNLNAQVDIIRNMIEMCIKGSSYKIKEFIPVGNTSVGEFATMVTKGMVAGQMFANINVAINISTINLLKSLTEKFAKDPFTGKSFGKSLRYTMRNINKCFMLGVDSGIIRQTEQDTYRAGYAGSVSNKSWFTSYTAGLMTWASDAYFRVSTLISRLMDSGAIKGYDKDLQNYDDTKDPRMFNEDGSQTDAQKAFWNKMKEIHRSEGVALRVDNNGVEHLTRPFTMGEYNAIKEYSDKRVAGSYDNLGGSIIKNSVLGRMAMTYFSWFPSAMKGLIGKSMKHDSIYQYNVDDAGNVYKDVYFSEGMLTTLANIGKRAWRSRDLRVWNHVQNDFQRNNLKRMFATVGLGVMLKIAYNFLIISEWDDDDKYGIVKEYRLLKNFDYAAEGLFAFMYSDALQRIWHPFPVVDGIASVFTDYKGRFNFNARRALAYVPGANTVSAVMEVTTGSNLYDTMTKNDEE